MIHLFIKQFLIDKITYSSQTGIDSLKIFTKSLIEIYKQASETMLSSVRNDTVDMSEYNDTKSEFLELTNNHIFFTDYDFSIFCGSLSIFIGGDLPRIFRRGDRKNADKI